MNDDLIKRSDAIAEIYKVRTPDVASHQYAEVFVNAVRRAPSADRPQGEWIVDILNYKSVCSVCGANETDFIYGTEMWYGLGESRFCPNCGAELKGADDETD